MSLELAIKLRAEGAAQAASQFGSVNKRFSALASELKKTAAVSAKVQKTLNLETVFAKNAKAIEDAKSGLAGIKSQLDKTRGSSKSLTMQYAAKSASVKKLISAQAQEKSTLEKLRQSLKMAGVDTKNLAKENDRYAKSVTKATAKLNKFGNKHNKIQGERSKGLVDAASLGFVGQNMMTAGRAVSRAISSPVSKIKAVEKSKGELQSIMSKDGAQKIVDQGRETSKKIAGINTAIFTGAAYTIKSAMSGLSDDAVANMTTAAAVTAKATKSDLGEMTSLFAKGAGIFKDNLYQEMSDSKFGDVFGSAVASTVETFDTTGTKMAAAIRSAGSGASLQGIDMGEQLAVLGALQKTMKAEQAGTAYLALSRNPARAQDRLNDAGYGVELLNEDNNMKSMPDLLQSMRDVFGGELDAIESGALSDAFGDEAKKLILNLWNSGEIVREKAKKINDQSGGGLQYSQKMMDKLQDNFSDRMDINSQRWSAIQEQLGEALIPVFEMLLPHLEAFSEWLGEFISKNKGVASVIAGIVATIGLLLTTGGGLVIALAALSGASLSAAASLRALSLSTAMGGLGAPGGGGGFGGKVGKVAKVGGVFTAAMSAVSLADTWTDDKKTTGEKMDDTTQVVGGLGGMYGGAVAGAAIGSMVPFVGTAIGGLIGGALGYWAGSEAGDAVGDLWKTSDNKPMPAMNEKTQNITVPQIVINESENPAATAKAVQDALAQTATKADASFDENEI